MMKVTRLLRRREAHLSETWRKEAEKGLSRGMDPLVIKMDLLEALTFEMNK